MTGSFSSNALGEGNPITTIVSGVEQLPSRRRWNYLESTNSVFRYHEGHNHSWWCLPTHAIWCSEPVTPQQGDSIHQAATLRVRSRLYKTAVRAGDWNPYSGWSSAPSVVESGGHNM